MSIVAQLAFYGALAIIALIGLDLLIRQPGQRGDRTGIRAALPEGTDPTTLRRRTPQAQRLSGAVLIVAVLTIFGVVGQRL
jgi:hypothetical protein